MKVKRHPVRVANTRVGRGVFATERFRKGHVIGEVTGMIILDPDYTGSSYAIDLENGMTLEPGAPFRYLNHSCRPNSELILGDEDEEIKTGMPSRTWLRALAKIESGEELTIDYAWPADMAIPCECGSRQCRGWIVDVSALEEVLARQAGSGEK
jgi:SET domain-containing protein